MTTSTLESNIELVSVGNRVYRMHISDNGSRKDYSDDTPVENMIINTAEEADSWTQEAEEMGIQPTDDGQYLLSFSLDPEFYKFLVGRGGKVKAKIEGSSKTRLTIPKSSQKSQNIKIKGKAPTNIMNAKTQIDIIVEANADRVPYTHFISVPLTCSTETTQKLERFYSDILTYHGTDRGIDESIFVPSSRVHITLGMLRMNDEEILNSAKDIIQEVFDREYSETNLNNEKNDMKTISLKGINYMNDDPSDVNVLYIEVEDGPGREKLIHFGEKLQQRLYEEQIIGDKEREPIKLHITIMNSKYRDVPIKRNKHKSNYRNQVKRESFDASKILNNNRNISFGEIPLKKIELSKRDSFTEEGYWESELTLEI